MNWEQIHLQYSSVLFVNPTYFHNPKLILKIVKLQYLHGLLQKAIQCDEIHFKLYKSSWGKVSHQSKTKYFQWDLSGIKKTPNKSKQGKNNSRKLNGFSDITHFKNAHRNLTVSKEKKKTFNFFFFEELFVELPQDIINFSQSVEWLEQWLCSQDWSVICNPTKVLTCAEMFLSN